MPKTVVPLPGFLAALAPVLNDYGYLAVGGLLLVEDFGVPVPGETVLIAASVYAGAGRLSIVGVGLIALLAAVVGDSIGYAIGRFGGRPLVERYGKYVLLTAERLDKAEAFFRRHGGKIVAVARFIDILRQANGIIAGIAEMPWPKFLLFNSIGAALWVACWTTVGYLAGNHIGVVYHTVSRYSLYVAIALAVLIIALITRAMLRRRRRAPAGRSPDQDRPADRSATRSQDPR
ncbi:MAG: DedA family protein [Actinobacteria bacterium]|nr:DedA family protein [Actinomycetota bacterium]MBO0788491.1 DedA family protein [Actinomycetota bacterium]